ncbi:MAG: DsbC family protein [Rhodoferax sp.]
MPHPFRLALGALFALLALLSWPAQAQNAELKRILESRAPELKGIQEIRKTAIPGLFEIRVGAADIFYSDAEGNFLVQGALWDLRQRRNLTKERVKALTAFRWDQLPMKDAITFTRGNGQRKLAVFADPNCGYCKLFETELQSVNNITVHVFLISVLGPDSRVKNRNVWCARDRAKAWQDWMLRQTPTPEAAAMCDSSALERLDAFRQKYKIDGTPSLLFEDGERINGAIDMQALEAKFAQLAKP